MARTATGIYGGVAADERRAARRVRLLGAGLDLLGTEGWNATTVRAVCARANLTPRYFYESFDDLDTLLLAVFDEIAQEIAIGILAAVAPAPGDARATARAAIGAGVRVLTDDRRKAQVLFGEAMGSEPLARRRRDTLRGFAGLVAAQGRAFYGVPHATDRIIEVSSVMLVGGLAEAFAAWLDGTLEANREQLIDDLTDLFVATGEAAVRLAGRSDTAR